MRPRWSLAFLVVSTLGGASCGLFFSDIEGSGGAGPGGGDTATTTTASLSTGGGGEGGAGGKGPAACAAALESIGSDQWIRTIAEAEVLDVASAGDDLIAVGTAMAGVTCGVPFQESGLTGKRIFLLAVDGDTGELERVVDLGPAGSNAEVRLSHGGEGAPLVVWTLSSGLCVMPAMNAAAACSDGRTLRCDLVDGTFSHLDVAATESPLVLLRQDAGAGNCTTGTRRFGASFPLDQHVVVRADDGDMQVLGTPGGSGLRMVQVDQQLARITGICVHEETVSNGSCVQGALPNASHHMFATAVDGAGFTDLTIFTPLGTVVNPQFGFVAPSEIGVAYSAGQGTGDDRRIGWSEGSLAALPLTPLKVPGVGEPDFPTGIRSVAVAPGGQIIAGVTHADPRTAADDMEVFSCDLPECAPYAFWLRADDPGTPDFGTKPMPYAVVANDKSGKRCMNGATGAERGLLLGGGAILGGRYRCGRPAVHGVGRGVAADDMAVNAFLARLRPVNAP